jgi:2-oxoglutarate ferredoxin oxidoreductase subunit alpha
MGPATGGATTPAQGDIQFVRWGSSGGYPIIALAPSNLEECYSLTLRAFDLAERFRSPVFLMVDKELVMSMGTVAVRSCEHLVVRPRPLARPVADGATDLRAEETFLPWRADPIDQPPPFSPFGGPHILRFTGSSHDEHGMLTKDPSTVGRLNEHLWRKIEDHRGEIERVTSDIQPGARTLLISYGTTARAMQEAVAQLRTRCQAVSALTVHSLWPAPERSLLAPLEEAEATGHPVERVVVAELNLGQYRLEVERLVFGWAARRRCLAPEVVGLHRVDGELITPQQFVECAQWEAQAC